jgi:hypothetical protein
MKERRQGESLEIHGLRDSVVGRIEGSWVFVLFEAEGSSC